MKNKIFFTIILTSFLSACSTGDKKESTAPSVEERGMDSGSESARSQTYGASTSSPYDMSALDDPQSPLSERIIYFEYDKSDIQPQFRAMIEAHSSFLAANPNLKISLEGHADERGSREYNLALGERRSLSVKRLMAVLGVSDSQLRTISYGEERPIVEGHDDYSWSQNRRVELVY